MVVIDYLSKKPTPFIWGIALLLNFLIGFIDYLTGYEIGIGLLYLMPICLLSWRVHMKAGVMMSVISTITIITVQILSLKTIHNYFIYLWNISIHFGFFAVVAYLTYALSDDVARRKKTEVALRDRVQELNCIYSIVDLIEKKDDVDEIFQGTVELMTEGWSYPEIACARMTIDDQEFKTENFKETAWRMSADLVVQKKTVGLVEIGYLEEMPDKDEGPFSKEERFLLNTIAERMEKVAERKQYEREREGLVSELQKALSEVKTLSGLLPICAYCKKIRNDKGYWEQLEGYIQDHSEAEFSHGICPECAKERFPDLYEKSQKRKKD
jgi:hypothetical protein